MSESRPFSPKIYRTYPKPMLKLPPGACDTHFHFIGPQRQVYCYVTPSGL